MLPSPLIDKDSEGIKYMENLPIPNWARKWRILGIALVFIISFAQFVFWAIAEDKVQTWWGLYIDPILIKPVTVHIVLPLWQCTGLVIVTLGILTTSYILFKRYYLDKHYYGFSIHKLKPPTTIDSGQLTSVDVINAATAHHKGNVDDNFLIETVVKAVNAGKIGYDGAAELLDGVGYELLRRSDRSWVAIPKRSQDELLEETTPKASSKKPRRNTKKRQ